MTVASLELCKELYKLSGWVPDGEGYEYAHNVYRYNGKIETYLYDLGYLLRKLPNYTLQYNGNATNAITCHYLANGQGNSVSDSADTPEDAAAKLAIELFKQGVLKP